MGKLIGEKALEQYHGHHHHNQHGCCYNYSLEEKVSEFLDSNNFAESDACLNQETIDGYGSDGNESNDPIERTLYWESQEALLQEILERYVLTGSKLRQEICRIIEVARETDFCSCTKPSIDGCTHCLRKRGKKKQVPFVIELEFRDQFEIAKACDEYSKLVEQLPKCYAGKADYLNAMVGVMCDAAKRSMEEKNLHMGPWRKRSFMQMKWSNSSEPRSTE
ncbi:Protein of unknown function PDDEXK-like - like 10 [Theobroma cacao]|nr:Protein of unknown function PDDEXK-like - like 10 [Theobroma cacao]